MSDLDSQSQKSYCRCPPISRAKLNIQPSVSCSVFRVARFLVLAPVIPTNR
jgi:hypothetical protein